MSLSSVGLCALLVAVQADASAPVTPASDQEAIPVPVAAPTPTPTPKPTPRPRHVPTDASLEELWSKYVRSEA
ncbi:MAG: hypothetical protein V3S03_03995, partial [Vicinamibacteria bacterium]